MRDGDGRASEFGSSPISEDFSSLPSLTIPANFPARADEPIE
jgi:hypothetical protein